MKVIRESAYKNPESLAVIILAAGLGKRMKSDLPKVIFPVHGRPMVNRVISTVKLLNPKKIAVVIGHKGEKVKEGVAREFKGEEILFPIQSEMRGTGDAGLVGLNALDPFTGTVLIINGDAPLISVEALKDLLNQHSHHQATLSFLSFIAPDPNGYGRVIKKGDDLTGIVEDRDATPQERKINEVNSGIYLVDSAFLKQALQTLEPNNNQNELYLTDIVKKGVAEGQRVRVVCSPDPAQFLGVNDRFQLAVVQSIAMKNKIKALIDQGVTVFDPETTYVDDGVVVGEGTYIGPNTQIKGDSKIGGNVVIEGTAYLTGVIVEDDVTIKFGVRAEDSFIGKKSSVGPFAHLRPGTYLAEDVKIGNFVEVKKSHLKKGAKASHLTYLGDATVGENANIGAGTITCNYDGYNKHKTIIEDNVFIGSNASLVAPITIGQGAVVGAGSVISKDVSKDALAVERSEQREISGWAKKRREKLANK